MADISKEEFAKIYREKFIPILQDLEVERIDVMKKTQPLGFAVLASVLVFVAGIILEKAFLVCCGIGLSIPLIIYISILQTKIRTNLKKEIVSKILSLFGNLYFSENKDVISSNDIRSMGLFPRFTTKSDDDIIIGIHQGLNFVIDECRLTHTERHGKTTTIVTDFGGLLIKIQMKKNFSGKTIVGMKWDIDKQKGFEEVILEDVNFMKNKKVYSTDQIEARYILTTAFMERLHALGETFTKKRLLDKSNLNLQDTQITNSIQDKFTELRNDDSIIGKLSNAFLDRVIGVSAAFIEGYVYLFVPTNEDFFEIKTNDTLFDEMKYYEVYQELHSILSIIEYLKLNSNLGL